MTLDPRGLRRTLGLFATGVTVIATRARGEVHAMTANAFTSVSLDPPLVLVCLGRATKMAGLFKETSGFSVNVLRQEQQALSTYFAGRWKEVTPPPFRFTLWEGGPRLEGSVAVLGCTIHRSVDVGDHTVVFGEVRALYTGIDPYDPLLFFDGRYQRLEQASCIETPELGADHPPVQMFYDPWQEGP